ncbi:MAG: helix-turn-helix domain-containing protein [Candidatus Cryptobacteroides sp.]
MRLFRRKWMESTRKVIPRNGKERVLRQTLSSFLAETGEGMRVTMAFPYEEWNYQESDFREIDRAELDGEFGEDSRKEIPEEDRKLIEDLREIIRENVSNPELDVPFICEKMHISKSKLYYKVKTLSGISPIEFLRQYRLEMASQLLSEKRMNVSEVADAVGFNSVSYFSKAYKKRYGIPPSEKR